MIDHLDPTLITFCLYIFGMILIGFFAWRSTHNLSDFMLGGRKLGSFVTAMSAGASDMSGWLLMGLPGAVYLHGLAESWIAIGLICGAWLNWRFMAARLRIYTEITHNALTIPDFLTHRFEDSGHTIKILSALVILFFFTIYCASGMVAGARLFEEVLKLPYEKALIFGALATIGYVFIGGFLAVSWTDTIQASLMIFALLTVPCVLIFEVGGLHQTLSSLQDQDQLSLFGGQTSPTGILSLLAWGLGYFGQPHILTRFMAARSSDILKKARHIGMTWMILCLMGAVSVGLFGIPYFLKNPQESHLVNQNPELIFIALAKILFHPWIAGILLSAILAAVMSTLSCQLLICSSTLTDDFYKTIFRPKASQKELMFISRFTVFLVAVCAYIIALNPKSHILGLVGYAWAGFGASFGPVLLISLYWKRMTKNGALAGLILGTATVALWRHAHLFELYEMIPGFIMGVLGIIAVSLLDKKPSTHITQNFERMLKKSEYSA